MGSPCEEVTMAKIVSFGSLDKEKQEKLARIEENQKKLEQLASVETEFSEFTAADARRASASRLETNRLFAVLNPSAMDYEELIDMMRLRFQNITDLTDLLKLADPAASLITFDRSDKIKAFDESIIPFENPVVRLTPSIVTDYAGPIGILTNKTNGELEACLYYRKNYVFSSLWDIALFISAMPKYQQFYNQLLNSKQVTQRYALAFEVIDALQQDEPFNVDAITRQEFVSTILNKSNKLEDYIVFSTMAQYAVEKAINSRFVLL